MTDSNNRGKAQSAAGKAVDAAGAFIDGLHEVPSERDVCGTPAEEVARMSDDERTSFRRENARRRKRYTAVFIVMALVVLAVTIINVTTGSVHVSLSDIFSVITGQNTEGDSYDIIWKIRLPRILAALLLGGALAVSGFLLQTFFENPIAGPYVLGISHGAKMTVALTMIVFAQFAGAINSWMLIASAFVGALLATGFILLISRRIDNMAVLLVAGIMVGYLCSAVTDFIINFAADSEIANLKNWSLGSFSGLNWSNVEVAAVIVIVAVVLTFLLSKPIGAFQLGESYAQSMGVNIKRFRVALILLSSILSATVTAFAGPIAFIGIAVPFLVKQALGTAKPLVVIPATFLGGAAFCMVCDLIARMAFAPVELNISTVTAIFGAPVVIYMMLRRKRRAV